MPRKKRATYRRKPRRRYRRRYRRKSTYGMSPVVSGGPGPLGKTFRTVMNYSEPTISLDSGTSTLADFIFRANGIYDPSVTGVGHQPLGYDQIIPMYSHWVVIGASIKVTFMNTDTSNTQVCGISVANNSTAFTNDQVVLENSSGKSVFLGPAGSSNDSRTLTLNINPNKFLGRSKPLSDPELKGSASSDPTEQAYFHVWAGSLEGNDSGPIQAATMIKYTVVFIEPTTLVLS